MTVRAEWQIYFARHYGRLVVYLCLKERGLKGGLHLHCLVDRYPFQKWMSAFWSALGGGRAVDIRYDLSLKRRPGKVY